MTLLAAALPLLLSAQDLPQPSPKGRVEQVVGLTNVTIEYSRPSVRGRQVFGDLVPMGELWRLGANKATLVTFDGPVVIEGATVPAGTYSLFAVPGKETWVFHLNRNIELHGTDGYKAEEDLTSWKSPALGCEFTETLTIGLDEVKDDKARVDVRWENLRAGFIIQADATEKALANIKATMAKADLKAGNYNRSARYCVEKGVMLQDALGWAQKAASMDRQYWILHTLALCQAANGKYKEAVASANESMALAQKDGDQGYVKMNKARIEEWMQKQ